MRSGGSLVTPQFLGINPTGTVDLQEIKCNEGSSDAVFLSPLSNIGLSTATYGWVDWYENEDGETEACWIDLETFEKVEGVSFDPGTALWIEGESADQALVSAGQVGTEDVVYTLQSGGTSCGNCTPVVIDLQDVICNEGSSDAVFLSPLSNIGLSTATYGWVDWYENEEGETEACWIDLETFEKVTDVKIEAGIGLWVEADSEDNAVIFPGVEL